MLENEQRAHDLALLYMLMEIKHEQIVPTITDDTKDFAQEYQRLLNKFLAHLEHSSRS